MEANKKFTLGLDAGYIGRWARLILGGIIPLWTIASILVSQRPPVSFYGETLVYLVAIFIVYLAAHYFFGERFLAKVNPWIGTIILVGPPTVALVLGLGPSAFQMGLALYIAISLIFNFIMSYGGCEVMAIPSLIFGQRYVVYCPWNAVDLVDKVIADRA